MNSGKCVSKHVLVLVGELCFFVIKVNIYEGNVYNKVLQETEVNTS